MFTHRSFCNIHSRSGVSGGSSSGGGSSSDSSGSGGGSSGGSGDHIRNCILESISSWEGALW